MAKNQVKSTKVRDSLGDRMLQGFTTGALIFVLIIIGYPLIYCISSSFSSSQALSLGKVWLFPVDFNLIAYDFILHFEEVWLGYRNTIFYTVTNVALTMFFMCLFAFPLSRRNYQGKNLVTRIMLVAMLTGAGLIPTFLLRMKLGLNNNVFGVILIGLTPISHIFIMRTSFKSTVPYELYDAAMIDGASEFRQMLTLAIPLCKATFSVMLLRQVVATWNDYYNAMIYLSSKPDLWPLPLVMRNIMTSTAGLSIENMGSAQLQAYEKSGIEQIRYALIIVGSVPMVAMYLVCQKYFEKGTMIGSVKG